MPQKPRHTDTEIDDMLGRLVNETEGLPTYAALRKALPHGASNDRLAAAMQRLKAGSCEQDRPENCSGQAGSLASAVTGSAEGSDHGALYGVVAEARARVLARHAQELEAMDTLLARVVAICVDAEARAAAMAAQTVNMMREQVEADTVARIQRDEAQRIRREIYAGLAEEFEREAEAPRLS